MQLSKQKRILNLLKKDIAKVLFKFSRKEKKNYLFPKFRLIRKQKSISQFPKFSSMSKIPTDYENKEYRTISKKFRSIKMQRFTKFLLIK